MRLSALTSGLLLCLVLLFLFICMQAFSDAAPDAVRAATNSLIVAAAGPGVATNLSSRADGERALRKLIAAVMDRFSKHEAESRLSDVDVGAIVGRAADVSARE